MDPIPQWQRCVIVFVDIVETRLPQHYKPSDPWYQIELNSIRPSELKRVLIRTHHLSNLSNCNLFYVERDSTDVDQWFVRFYDDQRRKEIKYCLSDTTTASLEEQKQYDEFIVSIIEKMMPATKHAVMMTKRM